MKGQSDFERFLQSCPRRRRNFFSRPDLTRRAFFQVAGAGITASFLAGQLPAQEVIAQQDVRTIGLAENVIFILLSGAPSHTDTFDLKVVSGVTPDGVRPENVNGVLWPMGILPKLAQHLPEMAIVRSVTAWNLQHTLGQVWVQIGRNPAGVLGDVAPNIGSIISVEKAAERQPGQVFPAFLALNSASAVGSGYLPSAHAPFKIAPSTAGLANVTHPDGASRFDSKWNTLVALDEPLRKDSPLGAGVQNYDEFYQAARGLMYNPVVDRAFRFTAADSQRYGGTAFGNACLVAKQVLAANCGTRFIQITLGGWDMHSDIYGAANPRGTNIFTLGKQLDDGLSELFKDLSAAGLFDRTLIVMMGEFGRTVGKLTSTNGRDHYRQQFCVFAGARVKGGRVIGATDATGANTVDYGWSRNREIKPEDIEATIYSAMGINWTTVRYDDPFGRGFYLVPDSDKDVYGPIQELWA
jgi:hypothetical protein